MVAWEARLTSAGVPAGLVGDIRDAITRADQLGLDPLLDLGPGCVRQVRHPVRYATNVTVPATAPLRIGQDSDRIRAWLAGQGSPLPHPSAQTERAGAS